MPNSQNVGVGKPEATGGVWTAPADSKIPTDGTTALDGAFKDLGYISSDGYTNNFSKTSEDIKAWGGDTVMTSTTESSETFSYTMIETNEETAKEFYGAENVTGTREGGDLKIVSNAKESAVHPYVIEELIDDNTKMRTVIPRGKISELGELVHVDGQPIGYPVTIKALPDSEGNRAYRYIAKKEGV